MAYRFGPFLYDATSHRLLRDGTEIPLTHKTRELLLLFLHSPGRLLTRAEITEKVWPDVAVTDDAVRFQMGELRKALGDSGEGFIRTIRREGYRWESPVKPGADRPVRSGAGEERPPYRARLVLDSREVQLVEGENILGRDPDAALWIDHPSVSRRHARVLIGRGKAVLEDLDSKNGTLLNGKTIAARVTLADGDEVRIGHETMVFRLLSPQTTQTERRR